MTQQNIELSLSKYQSERLQIEIKSQSQKRLRFLNIYYRIINFLAIDF